MVEKRLYVAPLTRVTAFQWEANFCESYPSVSISFGDGGSGGGGGTGDDFFDDEIQW